MQVKFSIYREKEMNTKRIELLFRLVLGLALIAQLAFGMVKTTHAIVAWTTAGALTQARYIHTATLLANGKVLVVGGYNNGALASAELYDPATDVWTTTGALTPARLYHTAT